MANRWSAYLASSDADNFEHSLGNGEVDSSDDIHERADVIRDAILAFEALSESLYEKAGSLTVSDTGGGPQFDVHIDGQRSKGITNMQIFCFDLMLTEISLRQGRGPGFLIHDSHLFDGVDERQVAKAL